LAEKALRPHYAASLFRNANLTDELTPVGIGDATNDTDAVEFAEQRAGRWLTDNGIDRATLQVVKDGFGMRTIPLEVHR
jgi:hypothetical protein